MPYFRVLPIFPENPKNPARCYMSKGLIEINKYRFDQLGEATQEYVINHELGHYNNQSYNEVKADEYALSQMALKKPYSLRNYLESVREVSYNNTERVNQAAKDVLTIAANQGSSKAKSLLKTIGAASADGTNNYKYIVLFGIIVSMAFLILIYKKYG